eukprot:m.180302 g.180302  ORF g.180302 m.180302 type:complete len:305 (+) comp32016_c0_seq1:129-1043(+)
MCQLLLKLGCALAITSKCFAATPLDPDTLTLYHVNPSNYTGITNMNTADAAGDAFFDMRSLLQYQQCHNATGHPYPSECTNPEQFGNDLIITKVEVLSSKIYGTYGECNICVNSTVPFTKPPQSCVDGEYICSCHGITGADEPCSPFLGKQPLKEFFQRMGRMLPGSGPPLYWMINLAERLGGTWYSSVTAGDCDAPGSKECAWKLAKTLRVVNATCQAGLVQQKIETLGQTCFNDCASPLNPHSLCYINCYYVTLLGPEASTAYPAPNGGLNSTEITNIWTDAFDGCPDISPNSTSNAIAYKR